MITATESAHALRQRGRLDARYFLSGGWQAERRLHSVQRAGTRLTRLDDLAHVWAPKRFKRVYAAEQEASVPYLRPYDIFDYVPRAADHLSLNRTADLASYRVNAGTLLQTCSGRNLGPAVMADATLSGFALSHDLVRIDVREADLAHYVLAFLSSSSGQELLRRDKSGTVIDHISPSHVGALEVPILSDSVIDSVASAMRKATNLLSVARVQLLEALNELEASLGDVPVSPPVGWSRAHASLRAAPASRLDAAYHDPRVEDVRAELIRQNGVLLGDIATVVKPAGRYKTVYVESDYGRPIMSGGQILQYTPINLRYISDLAFARPDDYVVTAGSILYAADGRAEEGLGSPAVVTRERDGWLASGHVGRIVPHRQEDWPWIYLGLATTHAQLQIRASASGSVVDSTFESDMANVVIPLVTDATVIREAWRAFELSSAARRDAINIFEISFADADRAEFAEGTVESRVAYDIARIRELTGFGDRQIAGIVDQPVGLIDDWLNGRVPPERDALHRIQEFRALVERLSKVLPASAIGSWLSQSVPSLNGERPLDVLSRGETSAVARVIAELEQPGAI